MGCFGSTQKVKKNTLMSQGPAAQFAEQIPNSKVPLQVKAASSDEVSINAIPVFNTKSISNTNSYQHQQTNFDDIYNIRDNLKLETNELDMDSVFGNKWNQKILQ